MHKGALRQASATGGLVAAAAFALLSVSLALRQALPTARAAVPPNPTTHELPPSAARWAPLTRVLLADDLTAAVNQLRLNPQFDALSPREMRALVDQSCRVPQLLQMDGRDGPDWRRDPYLHRLQQRCAGWAVPSMFVAESGDDVYWEEGASDGPPALLLQRLREARDPAALRRAWWDAYRFDALPQEQIFPDRRRLLPEEARHLIEVVIDWRQCARYAACGPDSLLTLRVCASHGCLGEQDLLGAWNQALSPRDFEAAQAISAWLPRWVVDE